MFFSLNCWKYGFALRLCPQKRNFISEMIVSTNILLINSKKFAETWKKQQKTDKNHVFLS